MHIECLYRGPSGLCEPRLVHGEDLRDTGERVEVMGWAAVMDARRAIAAICKGPGGGEYLVRVKAIGFVGRANV